MRAFIVVVALCHTHVAAVQQQLRGGQCGGSHPLFPDFVETYSRSYGPVGSEEYEKRKAIYNSRVVDAMKQNCRPNSLWTAGVTQLMDWTDSELAMLRGYRRNSKTSVERSSAVGGQAGPSRLRRSTQTTWAELPKTYSWLNLTAISEPRDQGACGSCWAFAAETVMRARSEIAGRPRRFSVSQMVSCAPNPEECGGMGGCMGSTAELGYEYVMKHGLLREDQLEYPVGGGSVECPAKWRESEPTTTELSFDTNGNEVHMLLKSAGGLNLNGGSLGMIGWTKYVENEEMGMVRALVQEGPLAVAVAVAGGWHMYTQGILQTEDCDSFVVNHMVTLYGYGEDDLGHKYWSLKNSWGEWWGEEGMIRLQRLDKEEEACGWNTDPEMGTGCKGGPEKVWVCGTCGILYDAVAPQFAKVYNGMTGA